MLVGWLTLLTSCTPKVVTADAAAADARTAYVGTYTRTEGHVDGQADGIYRARFDAETGALSDAQLVATVTNPSFVTFDAPTRQLYAVSELAQPGETTGFLHVFEERAGELRATQQLPTNGLAPCHVAVDRSRAYVGVANYVGGVAMLYFRGADGLAPVDTFTVTDRAKAGRDSWLHSVNFSPDGKLVAIADKGLDKVWLFELNTSTRQLDPLPQVAVNLDPGAGPRHVVWSGDNKYLYVINELSNSIDVLRRDGDRFSSVQTISTLPDDYDGTSYCADVHLHASGKFLYGSNRGHNSLVAYTVNRNTGRLTTVEWEPTRGDYPRNFSLSPDGLHAYVANQNTSNIVTLEIDPVSGALAFVSESTDIPTPVCIELVASQPVGQ